MGLLDKLRSMEIQRSWTPRPEVLLHPQIPEPMHGVSPRAVMGQAWWDTVRQAAYASTDYHCIACTIYKTNTPERWLEAHEEYEIDYKKGRMKFVQAVPLCSTCHKFIHIGRQMVLFEAGKITEREYMRVLQHGFDVITKALGTKSDVYKKFGPYEGKVAVWSKWRMVFNGRYYKPKFASRLQAQKHYQELTDD